MNIYNHSAKAVSFEGIKTWFQNNVAQKMTDQNKKIAAVVGLVFCFMAGLCFYLSRSKSSEKPEGASNVKSGSGSVKTSVKVKNSTPSKKNDVQPVKNNDEVVDPAKMSVAQIESALAKKSGIRIISAEDLTDDQEKNGALIAIKNLSPSNYLKEQFAGHQFYKTLLAVNEGNNEIVGYLSAEKQKYGNFHVYIVHVNSIDGENDVKVRLFLKAMDKAKEFGRQTFSISLDHQNETKNLEKYNSEIDVIPVTTTTQCVETTQFHLENFIYKKALEILINQ